MKLYEYVILREKHVKNEETGLVESTKEIVQDVQRIIAPNERVAIMRISKEIPENIIEESEILLRPF